ncbi:hypothetical protein SERLA73DRAFT_94255 [Serpula lacrymans var. lacrymans S7.3]|uniref:Phytocyanin domain-containing protein n=1 Tax=Serpula lacrymans var. lacrymans (strain S7.3) TaxID=936435 RepID=F8Q6F6_SERL3|nr:hypothetical protein SERLA73DRAFT_94255 [Serpula lacrymans var. lacrymans S7.3]
MFNLVSFSVFAVSVAATLVKAAQFNVTVGGGPLAFNPQSVNANPGDVVLFTFKQANHTATQSTLASPCSMAPGGFDSGFMPVAATNTGGPFPAAQYVVQNTDPVWVYCRQSGHCQKGMVFAINPGSKFAAFQAAAMGNSTANSTSASAATATSPSGAVTVTATVTVSGGQTVTTTYGSYPGSASPTSGSGTDHKVIVGGPNLTYTPSNITAQAGDTVTFQFMQKNHTATQSTFADPCRALTLTSTNGQIGFDSGFMPVSANATTFPTYTVKVNDTSPIWVYCKQSGHCGQGMVFSVNAVESGANNFGAFQARAKQLNGTGTASSSSSAAAPTQTNSAIQLSHGAGTMVMLVSVILGLMI